MNKLLRVAACAALLLRAFPAHPQQPLKNYWHHRFGSDEIEVQKVEGLADHIVDGKLHLRLRDFLALVLRNAPEVQVSRLDVYTPLDAFTSAHAAFNPLLTLNFTTLRSVSPFAYAITGTTGTTGTGAQFALPQTISSLNGTSVIQYQQLLPTGQTFTADFSAYRSSGDLYPFPSIFGSLNFQLDQPLLQNRTNLQYLTPIRIARTQIQLTAKQSEADITANIAQLAEQYWQAVLARETIRVEQQTLDLAQKSYDHDKQALDLGALSKLDIFQSETQVAERNRDRIQAEYQYKVQLDGLRRLIGSDLTPEMRKVDLVLDDDPSQLPDKTTILPLEEALAHALQARPETAVAAASIRIDELSAKESRDQLRPRLDLTLQGGSSGPAINPYSNGPYPGLGPTLQQVAQFKYPQYGFGVAATFPFHNSAAQASLADALVSRTRDAYRQRRTQEQITFDVRQALHSLELADATIEAAVRARDLAHQNVDAEQQKYQLGSITAFELLDSQSRLSSAESALVAAYISYQLAYVGYQRATQTLLEGFGMIIKIPEVH